MGEIAREQSSPNLFDYFDYREYLHDFYQFHKKRNSSYSYRLFARKAKLGSPNYLKLVVDGKRRITDRTLCQFARGLGLNQDEEKYFRELVMLGLVALSLWSTRPAIRRQNAFNYDAILEVAALFLGIFICMQAPIQLLNTYGPSLGFDQR